MRTQSKAPLRLYYTSIQCLYWMMFCSIYGFATLFLIDYGIDPAKIGGMLALINIVSAILQPMISQVIIRKFHRSLVQVLKVMTCLMMLVLSLGVIIPAWSISSYIIGGILLVSMQSFVNALAFAYMNHGHSLNFGFSRAGGSLGYAATSFVLGQLLARYSAAVLPLITFAEGVIFFIILWLMPAIEEEPQPIAAGGSQHSEHLLKKYPFLLFLFIGFTCLFSFHTMINSFLAQIFGHIGGGSKEVGIALMIAGLCELPGMILFERLVKRKNSQFWLFFSSIAFGVRGLLMLWAGSIVFMELTHVMQGLSFALFIPASAYLFNQVLADEDRVFGQTLIIIATTIGGVLGNILGGFLVQASGVWIMLLCGTIFALTGAVLTYFGLLKLPGSAQL
ncbi:hypothetical protein A5886_001745 [Enterococcus sp. 8G7_MSG3316]|uniref:Major facilitator superfamily (MFS) profile domain-containing protein n=1 Tax=Candidatus Enterococcus testudinis TaxID=1834191 RepID=A0A242A6K0_9ENTE|nr:MFS transporter [Enterococcus sp. 8G7_MSG3316]OTN76667.1 hypothetical protein A5886_001745 [Enterococcus sp. 8G7_MSG3316]